MFCRLLHTLSLEETVKCRCFAKYGILQDPWTLSIKNIVIKSVLQIFTTQIIPKLNVSKLRHSFESIAQDFAVVT